VSSSNGSRSDKPTDREVLDRLNETIEVARQVVMFDEAPLTQRFTAAALVLLASMTDYRAMLAILMRQAGFPREEVKDTFQIDVPRVPADSPIKVVMAK